ENNVSCFFFEAFDEPWKGGKLGAESYFGIFTVNGKAKFPIWNLVDKGVFKNLTRGGNSIIKTYNGDYELLHQDMLVPPEKQE
ncbi:MAG: glycosyl hydrolase family 17, partial [Candidatus Marinimicrobia bacterium]|nr:glycosyl hydrolase family 17 [Candidatus Neomarinimicrobiota bacterium]